MENQKINCTVKHCIHNDTSKCLCTLNSICVDNIYDDDVTTEKDDTICNDFECRCGDDCECGEDDEYEDDELEDEDEE